MEASGMNLNGEGVILNIDGGQKMELSYNIQDFMFAESLLFPAIPFKNMNLQLEVKHLGRHYLFTLSSSCNEGCGTNHYVECSVCFTSPTYPGIHEFSMAGYLRAVKGKFGLPKALMPKTKFQGTVFEFKVYPVMIETIDDIKVFRDITKLKETGLCVHTGKSAVEGFFAGEKPQHANIPVGGFECWLHVGKEEESNRILASKVDLARDSSVFSEMFYGVNALSGNTILIPDFGHEVCTQMAIGTSDITKLKLNRLEQAIELYKLAKTYRIEVIMDFCVQYVWPSSSNYVGHALDFATTFNITHLMVAAITYVQRCPNVLFKNPAFIQISQASLLMVVRQSWLMMKEFKVFMAVMQWASARCQMANIPINLQNQISQLGEIFHHIRLNSLTESEILRLQKKGILEKGKLPVTSPFCGKRFL